MKTNKRRYDILVIEDNPGDALLIEDFLDEAAILNRLYKADDFKSAEKLLNNTTSYDIILLDLSLPDKNGEELINDIQVLTKDKPIVILTGYPNMDFAIKSLALGASDYVLKDVLNATILEKSIIYSIERNKILVDLKESEKRYADLFQLSPSPMFVFERDSFEILDVNEAALQNYGYSIEEFMALDITQLMDEKSKLSFKNSLSSLKRNHQNQYIGLQNHITKKGQIIEVEVSANSFIYKGKVSEIISLNDVTEKNRQIAAIEEQNKRLKEIAWTQSHVVRAPLARIMGLVEAMKGDNFDKIEKNTFYDYIIKSADELDQIIREIVSKSQEINLKNDKS
ncbi:response regulator [Marivirga arenosa]|uniref:histidine kinase n=1 Tax=Marivirga arenosa TaxID=3059076 RepID=A0AA49GIC8_9BACT|nr:response regulator [Marivirga sp. ABR2-2]WKK86280.1 response regulator [Marivirga sp. ABR2-2]